MGKQNARRIWLRDVIVCACKQAADDLIFVGPLGNDYERRRGTKLRELLADSIAVVAAVCGLEENQIDFALTDEFITLFGIGKRDDEVLLPPKQERQHLPMKRVLVDDQDCCQGGRYCSGLKSAVGGSRIMLHRMETGARKQPRCLSGHWRALPP